MLRKLIVLGLLLLLLLVVMPLGAQEAPSAAEPVVYAVMFYSPSCPHCHTVMDRDVPQWKDEFGDQIQILYIDVRGQEGSRLIYAACDELGVPRERCGGVPMMVIGDQVMFGSVDVPARTPQLVRSGLAAGGIAVPTFGGLRDIWESQQAAQAEAMAESVAEAEAAAAAQADLLQEAPGDVTVWDRFTADPVANTIAVIVLVGLLASLFVVLRYGAVKALSFYRPVINVTAIAALLIAGSLVLEGGDTLATILSVGTAVLLGLAAVMLFASYRREWVIPVVMIAGVLAAVYLSYVEVGEYEAVCGAIGDCNVVQQSEYATLFGVLPVGVLGLIGYVGILGLWGAAQKWDAGHDYGRLARALLLGMVIFGVAFSAYLTFLEPFVIGASCAWCLTSALVMMLLLWLVAPEGRDAFNQITGGGSKKRRRGRA